MVHLLLKGLPLLLMIFFTQHARANANECTNFGSVVFFQNNNDASIKDCIQNASEEALTIIFPDGNTVTMNAVVAGVNSKTLSFLLSHYTESFTEELLKHRNFEDLSVSHLAVTSPNAARLILELNSWGADFNLLQHKKDGDFLTSDRGISALHYAIDNRATFDAILSLLASGIDTGIRDQKGNIPLNYAAVKEDRYDVLQLLLSWTEDLPQNDNGTTALHFAAQEISDSDNMELFLSLVDSKYHDDLNKNDMTILHSAATFTKNPEILGIVMAYSQEFLCEKDKKDARAIDYARNNTILNDTTSLLDLQNACQ
ncbi:ankyrin repeat domain-containing protein [Paracoccaceae bacterium]|nr:ankyrin repeat domain-containing protein [Paracoccaceae bacterium]